VERKNKNRGYQQLRVWQDAIELYKKTCKVFGHLPYEYKRVASNQIASVDSIHRNIAEGYSRRGINEYIYFLYIAISSLAESVSGLYANHKNNQVSNDDYEELDTLSYKLENGMLRLIESLEQKKIDGKWEASLIIRESNEVYNAI
jgi:four helix bundle protein